MRHVMLAVPFVRRQKAVECHDAVLRMHERSRIVIRCDRAEQPDPPIVQHLEHRERRLDRRRARVIEFRPQRFIVRLDRWIVLRQRPLEADVRVQVTVRYVMHDLTYGPPPGPVRCVKLRVVQTADRGAHVRRRGRNGVDSRPSRGVGECRWPLKAADRVRKVIHGGGAPVELRGLCDHGKLVGCSTPQQRHSRIVAADHSEREPRVARLDRLVQWVGVVL